MRLHPSGCFKTKLSVIDGKTVLLPLAAVQRKLDKPGEMSKIKLRLDDFAHAPAVRARLWGLPTTQECAAFFGQIDAVLRAEFPDVYRRAKAQLDLLRERESIELSTWIYMRTGLFLAALRDVFDAAYGFEPGKDLPDETEALVTDFYERLTARRADAIPPRFIVLTWEDEQANFLRAIRIERRILAFVMSFVILISGVLILVMLYTLVKVKTKDIGILKSIGGSTRGILALFVLNGTLIGILGAVIGLAGGLYISSRLPDIENLLSDWVGFRLFPRDVYYLDQLPVDKHPLPNALVFAAAAVLVSLLASAIPAISAARQDAVEALRHE
jgi:ABC-type lipoprotein release transport system permease subunit